MNIEQARSQMIGQQIRAWEVLDDRVLDAIASVPRESFVPQPYRDLAFADTSIPLAHGQEMMAPKVEGRMLQALSIGSDDSVLEIGTGTGFTAACLARLAARVRSVDIFEGFVTDAARRLEALGIQNVETQSLDVMSDSLSGEFDAVAVTASLPVLDERLLKLLNPGGRMFVVVGCPPIMEALLIVRHGRDEWTQESLFDTCLTPMINAPVPDRFEF